MPTLHSIYLRDVLDYRNILLVEQQNGDYATSIVRQFLFDACHLDLLAHLTQSRDERLAAIAANPVKEVSYHPRHSSEWVIGLGDGDAREPRAYAGRDRRAVDAHGRNVHHAC